jgi:hypothetical protein
MAEPPQSSEWKLKAWRKIAVMGFYHALFAFRLSGDKYMFFSARDCSVIHKSGWIEVG